MFHGWTRREAIRRDSARAEDGQERGHRTRITRFCGLATIIIGVTIATVTNRRTIVYRAIERGLPLLLDLARWIKGIYR